MELQFTFFLQDMPHVVSYIEVIGNSIPFMIENIRHRLGNMHENKIIHSMKWPAWYPDI